MRPQAKLICGKWSYIDPLVMICSSKKWLWLCFCNVNLTCSWKHTFSFGAIWGVFRKDFTCCGHCHRRFLFLQKVDPIFFENIKKYHIWENVPFPGFVENWRGSEPTFMPKLKDVCSGIMGWEFSTGFSGSARTGSLPAAQSLPSTRAWGQDDGS